MQISNAQKTQEKKMLQRKQRAEKRAYILRKEQILEREKDNDSLVMLFRADDGWWKICGRSVLYYTKLVAARLNKEVKVWPDRDYGSVSKEGIINIRDLNKFIKEVESLGLKMHPSGNDDFVAVELGSKVTKEDLGLMESEEQAKWEMADRMLMPAVIWPKLRKELVELTRLCYEMTRKFDAVGRIIYGSKAMDLVNESMITFNQATHGQMDEIEALLLIRENIGYLDGLMVMINELRLFDANKDYQIATKIMKVERATEIALKKASREKDAKKKSDAEKSAKKN